MNLQHAVALKSIQNARELGGYTTADGRTVKGGLLLRTANLHDISEEDARLLTDVFRVEHIIDFRMPMEIDEAPDPAFPGAAYHHLDVIDTSVFIGQDAPQAAIGSLDIVETVEMSEQTGLSNEYMYIGFLTSDFGRKAYADFFRILLTASPDRAVLWHCTSGKDRTGLAAMLLLSAFGVEESVILDDYLLTNEFNAAKIAAAQEYLRARGCDDAFIKKAVLILAGVDGQYMKNALAHLKKEYGSVVGYIRGGLHIAEEELDALKRKYLI